MAPLTSTPRTRRRYAQRADTRQGAAWQNAPGPLYADTWRQCGAAWGRSSCALLQAASTPSRRSLPAIEARALARRRAASARRRAAIAEESDFVFTF